MCPGADNVHTLHRSVEGTDDAGADRESHAPLRLHVGGAHEVRLASKHAVSVLVRRHQLLVQEVHLRGSISVQHNTCMHNVHRRAHACADGLTEQRAVKGSHCCSV